MRGWSFVESESAATDGKSIKRYQMQALSDIYRSVQSRLDSYRQSAAAIFIGVIAAILAFDSGFIRVIMDPKIVHPVVVGGCGLIVLVISLGGWYTIHLIGQYFGEMSAIVYKIDKINRVWDQDVWINGEVLLPHSFEESQKVGISDKDRDLEGWFDPAIKLLSWITLFLGIVHVLAYGSLAIYGGFAVTGAASDQSTKAPAVRSATPPGAATPVSSPVGPIHG